MTDAQRFSLAGAQRAAACEAVGEWVHAFLASEGSDNSLLAAALELRECWWAGPLEVETVALERLAGPERSLPCPIEPTEWHDEVAAIRGSIDDGWQPPPLIAEHVDGRLVLQDGNHRYEALVDAGATNAWVLVYFGDRDERDAWLADQGPPGRFDQSKPSQKS